MSSEIARLGVPIGVGVRTEFRFGLHRSQTGLKTCRFTQKVQPLHFFTFAVFLVPFVSQVPFYVSFMEENGWVFYSHKITIYLQY